MQTGGNINSYKQDLKGKIQEVASEMFKKNGIRQVRMDDIARRLSISKRTLYEIYDDKEHLLMDVVKAQKEAHSKALAKCFDSKADALEMVVKFYHLQMEEIADVNPLFFEDLRAYKSIMEYFHTEHVKNADGRRRFINKAIDEGLFNKNLDYDFIFQVMEGTSDYVISNNFYRDYGLKTVFHNFVMVFLRGICTVKGLKRLDELMINI